MELKRGRKEEEENGDGAEESVDGYIDGFGKLICIPWTPTVQSRYDDAFSKSVNNEILWNGINESGERAPRKAQPRGGERTRIRAREAPLLRSC